MATRARFQKSQDELRVVGRPNRKVDAMAKCTGETIYADDIQLPRMLYGKILTSPHAHANILHIDTSRSEAMDGVHSVLTGEDVPISYGILPVSQDEHALVQGKVRFVGDPIVSVAAENEFIAEEAVRRIDVKYEILDPVMSIEEGLDPTKDRIHEYGDGHNIHKMVSLEFGEVEQGFAEADHLREDIFFYEGSNHLPLEQHAAVARVEANGRYHLWSSTQTPHYVHRALAKVLGVSASNIRVTACTNGGAFGGKSDPFPHEILVCKMAERTGRPVKITLTREEVFYAHRGRHPVLMYFKSGVDRKGRILALHCRTFLDGGAYGSYGVATTYYTGALQTVTYNIDHYKFEGLRVFSNKPPCGPKRGHGTPQPRYALECHLDKIAHDLDIDPVEIRKKHLVSEKSLTVNYLRIRSCGLDECLDRVVEASDFRKKHRKLDFGKGVGLAASSYISGAGLPIYWNAMPHSGVQMKIDRGGGVTVFCGSTEIGQGSDSILAYIVAEVLGIDVDQIHVVTADTDLTPVDLGSYSSRVTLMTGNAAIDAATALRERLFQVAAEELGVSKGRLDAADGQIFDIENPGQAIDFIECANKAEAKFGTLGSVGSYTPPKSAGKYKGHGVGPSPTYSFSACVIEVDIDTETGWLTLPKIWIAHDCGKAINPLLVEGQVEGSVYMGLGEALMEEQVFRKGVHKIPSMLDYKSPTFKEMPPVETFLVQTADPEGPFGAKEAGQGPLLPVPPALANAVYDAIGVRMDQIPIQPSVILQALEMRQALEHGDAVYQMKNGELRVGPDRIPEVDWQEPIRVEPPSEQSNSD